MAAAPEVIDFSRMRDFQLRNRVEANPGCVNDRDADGWTPLYSAVTIHKDYARTYTPLQLALWLMDEKGADVNTKSVRGETCNELPRHIQCLVGSWRRPQFAERRWLNASHGSRG